MAPSAVQFTFPCLAQLVAFACPTILLGKQVEGGEDAGFLVDCRKSDPSLLALELRWGVGAPCRHQQLTFDLIRLDQFALLAEHVAQGSKCARQHLRAVGLSRDLNRFVGRTCGTIAPGPPEFHAPSLTCMRHRAYVC